MGAGTCWRWDWYVASPSMMNGFSFMTLENERASERASDWYLVVSDALVAMVVRTMR